MGEHSGRWAVGGQGGDDLCGVDGGILGGNGGDERRGYGGAGETHSC